LLTRTHASHITTAQCQGPEGGPFVGLSPTIFRIESGDKAQTLPDDLKPTFHDNYENRHLDAHGDLPKYVILLAFAFAYAF
jgi:hypothetical protein